MARVHLKDRSYIHIDDDKYEAVEEAYSAFVERKEDLVIKLPNQTIKSSEIRKMERSDGFKKRVEQEYSFDQAEGMLRGYLDEKGYLTREQEVEFLNDQMAIKITAPYGKEHYAVADPAQYRSLTAMISMWQDIKYKDQKYKGTGVVSDEIRKKLNL
jgi:hypothetical protein|tara:strand:+ start:1973 stop:2443 length:471 start_codon:yes stop_codon:yes gene_type:complete